jgi:CheY-like chemotaxis protein
LPLAPGQAPAPVAAVRHEAVAKARRSTAERLRVLVVDDNIDAADMLDQALRVLGCSVQVAHDGDSALAATAGFAPDLALVDIGLPVMNGYELVGHLRRLAAAPRRIVAITGYGQAADYARSRAAGFDEHIVKPVDLGTLEKLLDRSRVAGASS